MNKTLNLTLMSLCLLFLLSNFGCSVNRAAKQPDEKNINLLSKGTSRDLLLGEFGTPISSEIQDGKKVEIFNFIQGYSSGTKSSRVFLHGAADVMTLGLWELVGGAVEGAYDGEKMAFKVVYDENDKIESVTALNEESTKELSSKE